MLKCPKMQSGARDIQRRPTCVFLPLIPTLVVILAVVLYGYLVSNNSDTSSENWSKVPSKSIDVNDNNLYKKKVSSNEARRNTRCNLKKVSKAPNLPLLLSFPVLRQCKQENVLERIGNKYKNVGTLLLNDDYGQKMEIISDEQGGNIREVNREILKQWLEGKGKKPISWTTLIDVLSKAGLINLATAINDSCESSVMDLESQFYPYDHVMQLAGNLRKVYTQLNPVDPTQNLLNNLGAISFSLPFVMPKVSHTSKFDDILTQVVAGSRVLITGRPGVGKSTLMRYAAKMWAKKNFLTHCHLLIHVSLLFTINSLEDLLQTSKTRLGLEATLLAQEIWKKKGEGVCFLFDAFDEYERHLDNRTDFVLSVIEDSDHQKLSFLTILMTSRPAAVTNINKHFQHKMEISEIQGGTIPESGHVRLNTNKQFDDVLAELSLSSRLLITGRPGVGKSTLMRYAAKMWANKTFLTHCHLLIHVSLFTTIHSLEDLVKHSYPAADVELLVKEIWKSKGNAICFLLDSFDEYVKPMDKRTDFVLKLIEDADYLSLSDLTIVMTSRPEAVTSIHKYFQHTMTISGFENRHIQSYIERLKPPLNLTIAASLEKNPHVEQMCFTPLHLTMMVRMASVDVNKLSYLTTETSLYLQFLLLTVNQYKPYKQPQTVGNTLEECFTDKLSCLELCFLFRNICKLAYDANTRGEQWFNSTLLPKAYRTLVKELNLFSIETRSTLLDDDSVLVYYLSQKTFQEFIVACHLYMLPQADQINEVYLSYAVHWEESLLSKLIWKFFFGLLGKYDVQSLGENFGYLSQLKKHCCNISISKSFNFDPYLNTHLLDLAYEAGMRDSLAQIVHETQIIVGPVSNDELHVAQYAYYNKPELRKCLLLNYALNFLQVRRLVLHSVIDCTALSRTEKPFNKHLHIEEFELTSGALLSEPQTNAILTVIPTINLRHLSIYLGLDSSLFILLEHLNIEMFQSLEIKRTTKRKVGIPIADWITLENLSRVSKSLKMLVNLRKLKIHFPLSSPGLVVICDVLLSMPRLEMLELSVANMNVTTADKLKYVLSTLHFLTSLTLTQVEYSLVQWDSVLYSLGNLLQLKELRLNLYPPFSGFFVDCTKLFSVLLNLQYLSTLELRVHICYNTGTTLTDIKRVRLIHDVHDNLTYTFHHFEEHDENKVENEHVSKKFLSLEYLTIEAFFGDVATQLISMILRGAPQLHFLDITLSNDNWTPILFALRNLHKIEHLILRTHSVETSTEIEENLAITLSYLQSLKHLDLSRTKMKLSTTSLLESLSNLTLLVTLDLSKIYLEDTVVEALAKSLLNLTQLEHLYLSWSHLSDNGLAKLAGSLMHLTQLTSLELQWNSFGDEGLIALSGSLPYLASLKYLDLKKNCFTDKGALTITNKLLNSTSLAHLGLESTCTISSKCISTIIKILRHLPHLKMIELDG